MLLAAVGNAQSRELEDYSSQYKSIFLTSIYTSFLISAVSDNQVFTC